MPSRRILLGVTGGVAAYKAAELTRLLVKAGHIVEVVMTEAATRFVAPVTFQALSGNAVYSDIWDPRPDNAMAHIELSRRADLFLIAPATADCIFKLAHGACDDLISTLAAARTCPLAVAPAMNRQMWENPANLRNIAQLQADGVTVLGPGVGEQACGEIGLGRMLEPEQLQDLIEGVFTPKTLEGKRVLLTAGPTFEPIDPVRGITNISSGKMGYALAQACRDAGAEVTLVSGPTALACPAGITRIEVTTAEQMHTMVMAEVGDADMFIAVAAVADYRVTQRQEHKIKKDKVGVPVLELTENPDILASVAALPKPPYCVGFAAESQNLLEYATAKRVKKNIPLIVANLAQNAMGADVNEVVLVDESGHHPLPALPKRELAALIVRELALRLT